MFQPKKIVYIYIKNMLQPTSLPAFHDSDLKPYVVFLTPSSPQVFFFCFCVCLSLCIFIFVVFFSLYTSIYVVFLNLSSLSYIFIRPKSDDCLALSVPKSVTGLFET